MNVIVIIALLLFIITSILVVYFMKNKDKVSTYSGLITGISDGMANIKYTKDGVETQVVVYTSSLPDGKKTGDSVTITTISNGDNINTTYT